MDMRENDNHKIIMIDLKENDQSEDKIIKILGNNPTLRELAKAIYEEFDENGNYIGK